jgi:hypothetical protein
VRSLGGRRRFPVKIFPVARGWPRPLGLVDRRATQLLERLEKTPRFWLLTGVARDAMNAWDKRVYEMCLREGAKRGHMWLTSRLALTTEVLASAR